MIQTNNTYIDFFAGCGGLSLGLGLAGWEGIFAIEKDPMAYSTFDHNLVEKDSPYCHFPNWPTWLSRSSHAIEDVLEDTDILEQFSQLSGKVTLVAGGPPCQGFSVAGARNGNDPRNLLVFKQIRAIEILRPKFAMIENVEGFERKFVSRPLENITSSVADAAIAELKKLGYSVGKVLINAADYGVPQVRKRVILFAISKDFAGDLNVSTLMEDVLAKVAHEQRTELDLPTDRYVNAGEALSDLAGDVIVDDPEFKGYTTCQYLPISSTYQRLMRQNLTPQIPTSHRFNKHSAKLIQVFTKAQTTQPPGRLSKEFLYENGIHSNKRYVLDLSKPCSTVTTAPDELIHFKHPRIVTLREMARLQSFPDDYTFYGRYTLNGPSRGVDVPRNAQIGNAIPPLAGRALGKALSYIIELVETKAAELEKYRNSSFEQITIF